MSDKWKDSRAILAPLAEEVRRHLAALEPLVKEIEAKGGTVQYFFNGEELTHPPTGRFDFEVRMSINTEL